MDESTGSRHVPRAFIYGTFAAGIIAALVIIYLGINGYIGTWIPGGP